MLQHATIFLPYRNNRESSETHCSQYNQKVATQNDIQCAFQLLHEPVNEEWYNDIAEENILYRVLLYVFIPAIFVVIMRNMGVTWLIALGKIGMNYG
jgi:hypothetical protein